MQDKPLFAVPKDGYNQEFRDTAYILYTEKITYLKKSLYLPFNLKMKDVRYS